MDNIHCLFFLLILRPYQFNFLNHRYQTMINKLIYINVLILLCWSCSNQSLSEVKITDEDGNVLELYFMDLETQQKEGEHKSFYSSGKLSSQANYVRDSLDGERRWYYESGQVEAVETFAMGTYEGPYISYFENGVLRQKGQYMDNKANGIWSLYYESGKLKETVTFENNVENGPFEEFNEAGVLTAKGEYLNGDNEHGLLEIFNDEGTLTRKMQCDKGICHTIWSIDGEKTNS